MTQDIKQKVEEYRQQHKSHYIRAAEHFNTSYCYVFSIARGYRNPQRGKGKQILQWLTNELNINK